MKKCTSWWGGGGTISSLVEFCRDKKGLHELNLSCPFPGPLPSPIARQGDGSGCFIWPDICFSSPTTMLSYNQDMMTTEKLEHQPDPDGWIRLSRVYPKQQVCTTCKSGSWVKASRNSEENPQLWTACSNRYLRISLGQRLVGSGRVCVYVYIRTLMQGLLPIFENTASCPLYATFFQQLFKKKCSGFFMFWYKLDSLHVAVAHSYAFPFHVCWEVHPDIWFSALKDS